MAGACADDPDNGSPEGSSSQRTQEGSVSFGKDSAIVSVIAGVELTSVLETWRIRNGSDAIPLFILAMALYLALSLPTSYFARWYERKLRAAL